MPRPTLTPIQRTANVRTAANSLAAAMHRATERTEEYGYDSPEARAAWEAVENIGATIHRQSRILAGKSRGG